MFIVSVNKWFVFTSVSSSAAEGGGQSVHYPFRPHPSRFPSGNTSSSWSRLPWALCTTRTFPPDWPGHSDPEGGPFEFSSPRLSLSALWNLDRPSPPWPCDGGRDPSATDWLMGLFGWTDSEGGEGRRWEAGGAAIGCTCFSPPTFLSLATTHLPVASGKLPLLTSHLPPLTATKIAASHLPPLALYWWVEQLQSELSMVRDINGKHLQVLHLHQ